MMMRKFVQIIQLTQVMQIARKVICFVQLAIISFMFSSCSVYSTGFNCPDSKGAHCAMLNQVDKMVDSGEIDTVYIDGSGYCKSGEYKASKCNGSECYKMINVPAKKALRNYKIKFDSVGFEELNKEKEQDKDENEQFRSK